MTNLGSTFFVGVDLGYRGDYSAIAVLQQDKVIEIADVRDSYPERIDTKYGLVHLERTQAEYPNVVERIKSILQQPELMFNSTLLVDKTGLGDPVVQMLEREGLDPIGITIHGGEVVTERGGGFSVPKSQLVSALVVLFQSGRMKISKELKLAEEFEKELKSFHYEINKKTGHESFESGEVSIHDDLVIATAMPVWYAMQDDQHHQPYYPDNIAEDNYDPLTWGL